MKAILLLGHGSRARGANQALYKTAQLVKEKGDYEIVECAFLSLNPPYLPQGIDRCIARGARKIILIPYFLLAGEHVLRDLPEKIAQERARHPDIEIVIGRPIGSHPKIAEIVLERIREIDGPTDQSRGD